MMDLKTVKDNLADDQFDSVEECLADIQLIWDNCKIYNKEGSPIYNTAVAMETLATKLAFDYFGNIKKVTKSTLQAKSKDDEIDQNS